MSSVLLSNHWRIFTNILPPEGEYITIIWNDDSETDVIWEGSNFDDDVIPIFWRYCKTK